MKNLRNKILTKNLIVHLKDFKLNVHMKYFQVCYLTSVAMETVNMFFPIDINLGLTYSGFWAVMSISFHFNLERKISKKRKTFIKTNKKIYILTIYLFVNDRKKQ